MSEIKLGNYFNLNEVWQHIQRKPASLWLLLGMVGLGLCLLLSSNGNEIVTRKTPTTQLSTPEKLESGYNGAEERLEAELTKTIEAIVGEGNVRVDVNLKSGSRKVWERQTRTTKRVAQETASVNTEENNDDELVFAKDRDGRDSPILKEELAPEVQGVIIVIAGAQDSRVKKMLTDTVMTILGLPAHRVMIINGEAQREAIK